MLFWVSYVMLWVLVLFQLLIIVVLVRKHSDDGRAETAGPAIGTKAPALHGRLLGDGLDRSVGDLADEGGVVAFLAAGCEPCWDVREVVGKVCDDYRNRVRFIASCSGDRVEVAGFAEELGEHAVVIVDAEGRNAQTWGVFRQPCAVAFDRSGIVVGDTFYVTETELTRLAELARGS